MAHDLELELTRLGALVDDWTRDALRDSISPEADRLRALLEYHLGWRGSDLELLETPAPAGKKLRPALVLLTCEAVAGEITAPAREAAVAIELIHNFSLVHDDIQDRSELRRHRPTVWTLWGMPQGINAGDALFALAQTVIVGSGTSLAAEMARELNTTALQLAEGQFLDIDLQQGETPVTPAAYETMVTRKTGVLFATACRLGAMAGGADAARQHAYAAYGRELGIAFQEQDDLLGVWGSSSETGKPDAADIVERKRGLPAALALSRADAPEWLRALYGAPGDADVDAESVDRVTAHFDALGLRQLVEQRVAERYQAALSYLDTAAPCEPWRGYLTAVCEALVARRT
ncbi:MAG TPA: polyprenyl synthetase family protein [Chloroflexota bacterium]|nr:polyprenyl synthetase family protein [Chloroflexota bacterium]